MTKYGAKRTEVDGTWFASRREAERYKELRLLEAGGVISELELQPRFPLTVNGKKICVYVADFRYLDNETGEVTIEDVKGVRTDVFKLKAKLLDAVHGITVREIR